MSAITLAIGALKASSGVTDIVTSAGIYPGVVPLKAVLPAIAVSLTAEDEGYSLQGAWQFPLAVVQINCQAYTAKAAIELGERVKEALRDKLFTDSNSPSTQGQFQKGSVDFTDYTDDQVLHRRVMSFDVRWR